MNWQRAHVRLLERFQNLGCVTTHVCSGPPSLGRPPKERDQRPPKRINRRFTRGITIKRR